MNNVLLYLPVHPAFSCTNTPILILTIRRWVAQTQGLPRKTDHVPPEVWERILGLNWHRNIRKVLEFLRDHGNRGLTRKVAYGQGENDLKLPKYANHGNFEVSTNRVFEHSELPYRLYVARPYLGEPAEHHEFRLYEVEG